jgi:site-specific DNA recombinase
MKAIGYIRVSTGSQEEDGHSLEVQRGAIERYCAYKGFDLVDLLVDPGVSAGKPLCTRPKGRLICDAAESGAVQHVVATKLDRVFRNTLDCLDTLAKWEKAGVAVHFIEQDINTDGYMGRFILTLLAAVAEMERGQTSERTRAVTRHLRASGRAYSHTPYGYDRQGAQLVPNEAEQAVLAQMRQMRAEGLSYHRIAARLNEDGIPPKSGAKWHPYSVQKVIGAPV